MLFLKSTSINEIFNKKNRLNSSLQPFKALSERRRGRDKEELSQNRNSVREKEKNYKAIYSTDNAAKGKRIRWGFLLGSRDAHSKNRRVSFRHGEGRISGASVRGTGTKKAPEHFCLGASSKTATTYSPTCTQYHRRGEA